MNTLVFCSAYSLDMLIITIFLNNLFPKKETFRTRNYLCALLAVEILIFINEILSKSNPTAYTKPLTIAISIITTLILCAFFNASFKLKLFASVLFQVLVSISEFLFTWIVSEINPSFFTIENINVLYNTMNGGSKLISLIFCISISIFWTKDADQSHTQYHLLLLSTPIITLFIYCVLSLKRVYSEDTFFYNVLFVSLFILNIINFILLKKNLSYTMTEMKNAQMSRQLIFQQEKYNQLSESYRQNRRLIHDIKKHYFTIQEYINHNDMQGLMTYTNSAIQDLESVYAKYNTGNLVIDSFLSNYETLFQANHISFTAHLNVDYNRVPINNYDLCVILGNILDNALQACQKSDLRNSQFYIEIETTNNDKFRIHTENTYKTANTPSHHKDNLIHGYGLPNIKNTVEKNNGFLSIDTSDNFIMDILIPIIDEHMRLHRSGS